nr:zinc finger, CCHC-type [Tanacetum cinerariifolium]
MEWYRNFRIVLSTLDKLPFLEQPVPVLLVPTEGQDNPPDVVTTHQAWVKAQKEIAGLMLMTMKPHIKKILEHPGAYDMLKELKTLYVQQADQELLQTVREFHTCKQEEGQSFSSYVLKMKSYIDNLEHLGHAMTQNLSFSLFLVSLRKEYAGFVQNYNMHSIGKTVTELHAMLKLHEQTLPLKKVAPALHAIRVGRIQKNQKKKSHMAAKGNQGKGKEKMGYAPVQAPPFAPKPKNPPTPKNDNPEKDAICHQCGEVGHWRRNFPIYLLELMKKKKLSQGASTLGSQGKAKINLGSAFLWHCHLGHINKKLIEKFQHNGLLDLTEIKSFEKYVSCMSSKMARKHYSHQVERAKDLLGLIYTDVCGPFKIMSRQGAYYFVTFTDDFSRYDYVYLLKHKHEVFETFKVFQKEVENQLRKTIKSLRSDRGGDLGKPANYKAALLDPEYDKRLNAINVEMQSMKDNEVWDLVELPPDAKTVGHKWLFKKKTYLDGAVQTYKARLVAKGFTQTLRIDYEETLSPVADIKAIRILITIAAFYDYEIWKSRKDPENQKKKPHKAAKGNQGKSKAKMGYAPVQAPPFAPKPKNPPTPKNDNLTTDMICHQCGEVGCGTHIYITTQGLRGSKKLKPGALSLYVGDGHRAAIEAIGDYHLCFPSRLVLILHNCHYAPFITRGIISASRLAKINLGSALLWHCHLGHINKKLIEKLQHNGLLDSNDIKSLEKCVACMSVKMARKHCSLQVERAKDLLGLIPTDVCGLFKIMSRQGAYYFITFTDDFSRYDYVYLLKHKHEVFETFKVFQKELENQFRKTIKSLRSDHGGDLGEPANYKAALLDPKSDKWLNAINVVMQSMKDNKVWELVELSPDAKSLTGCVFVLNGGDVDWKSTKQSIFATSSTDAEYIIAFDASKEAVWIRKFISRLGVVPIIEEPINILKAPTGLRSTSIQGLLCCSLELGFKEVHMTGCVVLFPVAVTFFVTWWIVHFFDGFFSPIYERLGVEIFDQNTATFKEVAIIRHPHLGEYAFGFITSSIVLQVNNSSAGEASTAAAAPEMENEDEELCSVYVPTNHLYTGDVFLVNSEEIIRVNLSIQEGIE